MSDIQTYEQAVARLHNVLLHLESNEGLKEIVDSRNEVLDRFQPIFSEEHLPELSQHEFHSFLLLENNRHWSGLHRHSPKMTSDMPALREALDMLLYGGEAIERRLTQAVSMVSGMGRAVATAILLIVHPEKYGVWNSTSEGGLKFLNLWPRFERGASLGERYAKINDVLNQVAQELDIGLWTLDTLWWDLDNPDILQDKGAALRAEAKTRMFTGVTERRVSVEGATLPDLQTFSLERHLQDFLWDNWRDTPLGQEWELYAEEGEPDAGYEFPSGVGRIDLLAKHKAKPQWLIIELKRGQTSDATVGQVLRYMGWIKENLAEPDEEVRGLIIAHEADDNLRYALSIIPDIDLQCYEVQFHLHPVPKPGKETT